MSRTSILAANSATFVDGTLCDDSAASVRLTISLSRKARQLFDKPYRALVDILNISERDAHYRLAGKRKYTAAEIAKLLQSEEGIHFLAVLMERKRPAWWRAIVKMAALGSVEQRRQRDMQLMQRVFNADKTTASQFSDSFRAQDPDFFGAVLQGYDELAGIGGMDSAVAPRGRGR